jgi:hypothetical protein
MVMLLLLLLLLLLQMKRVVGIQHATILAALVVLFQSSLVVVVVVEMVDAFQSTIPPTNNNNDDDNINNDNTINNTNTNTNMNSMSNSNRTISSTNSESSAFSAPSTTLLFTNNNTPLPATTTTTTNITNSPQFTNKYYNNMPETGWTNIIIMANTSTSPNSNADDASAIAAAHGAPVSSDYPPSSPVGATSLFKKVSPRLAKHDKRPICLLEQSKLSISSPPRNRRGNTSKGGRQGQGCVQGRIRNSSSPD